MLDIRLLREKSDFVRERLATLGGDLSSQVDAILAQDTERRRAETELQKHNAERNRLSKEIGQLRAKKLLSAELEAQVRQIGEQIAALNAQVAEADERQKQLLLHLQNLPHASVPIGPIDQANPVVRVWVKPQTFSLPVRDLIVIATILRLVDFERGPKFICIAVTT